MSDTSWERTLPHSIFELWLIRLAMVAFIFGSGWGARTYWNANRLQDGQEYMLNTIYKVRNWQK